MKLIEALGMTRRSLIKIAAATDLRDIQKFSKQVYDATADIEFTVEVPAAKKEKIAPVQGYTPGIPWSLHLEAYDAYSKRWGPQLAMIDLEGRNCRGGFGTSELDGFIPGWRDKVSEISSLKAHIAELEAQLAARIEPAPAAGDKKVAFERWAEGAFALDITSVTHKTTMYKNCSTNYAWLAWQACAALHQPVPTDPMDWPLPCDVTVGHGTMRKGIPLRALVARMKVLHSMAKELSPKQDAPDIFAEMGNPILKKKCINQDLSGNCLQSNIFCDYPDCEEMHRE